MSLINAFFKQLFITNNPSFYNKDRNSTRDGLKLSRRIISGIVYFNSINLMTPNDDYDCKLTISFIKYNIAYNLKSDLDFNNYLLSNCESQMLNLPGSKDFDFICNLNQIWVFDYSER